MTASPRQRVAGLFPPGDQVHPTAHARTVGVEHELIASDAVDGSVVPVERLRRATEHRPYSRWLTFEPGGQIELSLPCAPNVTVLEHRFRTRLRELRHDCIEAGIALDARPVDPRGLRAVPLQLTRPRYMAMQQHFDRIGSAGRRMMRLTASTQPCISWSPGATGREQWRLALLSAPFIAAAFARSSGPGSRLATWLDVDPRRTACDDRLLGDDPVAAYLAFAEGAQPFTPAAEHLSTLFPPVRPRGRYLEFRYLDVQPDDEVVTAVSVLDTLLHDDEVRQAALHRLDGASSRLADQWRAAADGDLALVEQGLDLVALTQPQVPVVV